MSNLTALAALTAAALTVVAVAVRRPPSATRWLRRAALVITVLVAGVLTPYTVADSGAAAWYLLGVPVVVAALPVAADQIGIGRLAADVIGALAMTGWALLLGLGIGPALFPSALLMIVVVALDVAHQGRRPASL
ncbi:hypothetical protein ACFOW4_18350 [Micromonospora sp. GCM10011542]|uniref:hypothetical protein n=1 Tax=Micromonospora sp. GCM10011542 TaxID=3317337 RepID=UPI003618753C